MYERTVKQSCRAAGCAVNWLRVARVDKGHACLGGIMLGNLLTRRATLLSFGAFAATGLSGCNTTPTAGVQPAAASGLAIGAITVDRNNPHAAWLWIVADNLRLRAENAVTVAQELL